MFDLETIGYEFFSDGSLIVTDLYIITVTESTYVRNGNLIKFVLEDGKENTLMIFDGGINDSVVIKAE